MSLARRSLLLCLLTACSAEEPTAPGGCPLGTLPFGGECIAPGSKADLPNEGYWDREYDGAGYGVIADAYAADALDLTVDLAQLTARWPLDEDKTASLTHFGTPILLSGMAYYHTALDILRSDAALSDAVVAPFAGKARVFDWWGTPGYAGDPYAAVVAVWDPRSHVIAQLMHVQPSAELIAAGAGTLEVVEGQVIGSLARAPVGDEATAARLSHTHLDLIDGARKVALNPVRYLPYRDATPPTVKEVYLLDAHAAKQTRLVSGQLDLVVDVFDRDEDSDRNFEIGSVAFELYADGQLVRELPRCTIHQTFEAISDFSTTFRTVQLIDLGNAVHQIGVGGWPGSDVDNRERSFRYALTQLAVDADGRCQVLDDAAGFVDVGDAVAELEVTARWWDENDNVTEVTHTLTR